MDAAKTKPESVMSYTIKELHIVPGTNAVTVNGSSNDPDVKTFHQTIDIQAKIDNQSVQEIAALNNFFQNVVSQALDIDAVDVTGDVFTQTP